MPPHDFIVVMIDDQQREIRDPLTAHLRPRPYDKDVFSHWSEGYLEHLRNGNSPETKCLHAEQFGDMIERYAVLYPDLAERYRSQLAEWRSQQDRPPKDGRSMEVRLSEKAKEDAATAAYLLRRIGR